MSGDQIIEYIRSLKRPGRFHLRDDVEKEIRSISEWKKIKIEPGSSLVDWDSVSTYEFRPEKRSGWNNLSDDEKKEFESIKPVVIDFRCIFDGHHRLARALKESLTLEAWYPV